MANTIKISFPDGATTEASLFRASPKKEKAIIVGFPAMGVRAAYYEPFAKALSERGISCIFSDLRGLGTSSVRASRKSDFGYTQLLQDYDTIIQYVSSRFSNRPLFLLGHSLGGQVGSLYLSRYNNSIKGFIQIACCSVYYKGWKGNGQYRVLFFTQLANLIGQTLGYFPGHKLGFGGREARTVIKDWSKQGRSGNYILTEDDFDYESALLQIQIPLLSISIDRDWNAPQKAVEHLLQKFQAATIERQHVNGKEIGLEKLNHFNWAKTPDHFVKTIETWMTTLI